MDDNLMSFDNDDDESMIKYFREKIIGRQSNDDQSIKRIQSPNSSTDLFSTHEQLEKITSNTNDLTLQSNSRTVTTSSPIVIPKKPPRSNASSHSSSSYTSIADQMPSLVELSAPSRRDVDDVSQTTLPILPSTGQLLEHQAARDRISVKNKLRQPLKHKLTTLREIEDNETNLFSKTTTTTAEVLSSTPDEEVTAHLSTPPEVKVQQPLIDLSDINSARARLRMSTRSRDRSADHVLSAMNSEMHFKPETLLVPTAISPKLLNPIQRSLSCKRSQDVSEAKYVHRPFMPKKSEEIIPDHSPSNVMDDHVMENISIITPSSSRSSSQEHIYDNLDVFKRAKTNISPIGADDGKAIIAEVKTRENLKKSVRLRPLTVHVPANDETSSTNEFEQIFNQLKKRGSIRRVRVAEEKPAVVPVEETPQPPAVVIPQQEKPAPVDPPLENQSPIAITKPVEISSPAPTPIRRKTLGGVHLSTNNKVAADEPKPSPSWIDIAKQKQTKFQSISNESKVQETSEPIEKQVPPLIPSPVVIRKAIPSSTDIRSNRKSMFESSTMATTHPVERDSIRALKAGNPNRINNLIEFFDK